MKFLFEKKQLVHFGDADPQGIVYFAKISQWAHEVIEEYWASTKIGWFGWFQNNEFAVPLRHAEQDFFSPMTVGVEFTAKLFVSEITESSIRFKVDFLLPKRETHSDSVQATERSVAATAQSVHVFVDRVSFKKLPVPKTIRDLLI